MTAGQNLERLWELPCRTRGGGRCGLLSEAGTLEQCGSACLNSGMSARKTSYEGYVGHLKGESLIWLIKLTRVTLTPWKFINFLETYVIVRKSEPAGKNAVWL